MDRAKLGQGQGLSLHDRLAELSGMGGLGVCPTAPMASPNVQGCTVGLCDRAGSGLKVQICTLRLTWQVRLPLHSAVKGSCFVLFVL